VKKDSMDERTPGASEVTLSQVMLITDANPWGNVHGGTIMKLVDTAGAIAAHRHGRLRVVTAVWETSLETAVDVEAENVLTAERRHTSSAYLVYVALDEAGKPTPLPPVLLETEEDRARARDADARRRATHLVAHP
jgi:acyl-CoA hydrolase